MKHKALSTGVVALALVASTFAYAGRGSTITTVVRTLVDSENFGGCMVNLASKPAGLNCGGTTWVTASCSGEFNSPSVGWRKFESAQIAMATGARVAVYVDDERKHNAKCFLTRIDVLN